MNKTTGEFTADDNLQSGWEPFDNGSGDIWLLRLEDLYTILIDTGTIPFLQQSVTLPTELQAMVYSKAQTLPGNGTFYRTSGFSFMVRK